MTTNLQISAKTLGQLALPNFCGRCFWIRQHNPRLPFQVFPSIFSSIDSYSKKVTAVYHQRHLRLPQWLKPVGLDCCPLPVPHWRRFQFVDEETGIALTGCPDEVLRLPGRYPALAILDYKTARCSSRADELIEMYETQLNVYGVIAKRTGLGIARSLWLAYYEPSTEVGMDQLAGLVNDDSLSMRFVPKLIPVAIKPEVIPELLAKARDIFDGAMPESAEGCRDCVLLEKLVSTFTNGKTGLAGLKTRSKTGAVRRAE